MNEETKATIDRARALLSEATPGPWSVRHDGTAAWVDMGDVRRVAWLGHVRGDQNRRDARLMAAAPGLLAALCDALVHAERRAEEAEARDAHNRAEVERVIGPTLAAMKRAGIDSLPDATEELIRRLDAAEARVAEVEATQKMRAESADPNDETWHTREEYLRRVKADARVADLERVREEQAAKLRRHLDELRAATLHIEDLEAKNARLEAQAAVWREHTSALVAAMKTWGSWEDGVPDASDAGECGDVGRAFNAARRALHPEEDPASWRCSACGKPRSGPKLVAWMEKNWGAT